MRVVTFKSGCQISEVSCILIIQKKYYSIQTITGSVYRETFRIQDILTLPSLQNLAFSNWHKYHQDETQKEKMVSENALIHEDYVG